MAFFRGKRGGIKGRGGAAAGRRADALESLFHARGWRRFDALMGQGEDTQHGYVSTQELYTFVRDQARCSSDQC